MRHEEPDLMSEGEKAARKLNGKRALKFAKRRAAAKKAAETRRGIAGLAKKKSLMLTNVSFEHGN